MIVEEHIQEKMNFAEQEMLTAPVTRSAPLFDEGETTSSLSRARCVYIIDFFEERNRLPAEVEVRSEEFEANLNAARAVVSRRAIDKINHYGDRLYRVVLRDRIGTEITASRTGAARLSEVLDRQRITTP
jgi:hypothetical protein